MADGSIFSDDFADTPWWWRDFAPPADPPVALPTHVGTLVIGAGYAGTACALRLAEAGEDVFVLDAQALGFGASTRSGGQVSGGVNVGKGPSGKPVPIERQAALLRDAARGFTLFETLLERHRIRCGYHRTGRLNGFWSPDHAAGWQKRIEALNRHAGSEARVIDRAETRVELGSDSITARHSSAGPATSSRPCSTAASSPPPAPRAPGCTARRRSASSSGYRAASLLSPTVARSRLTGWYSRPTPMSGPTPAA